MFFGARSLGPADGAPVPLRIYFPSLDGAVESAPLLEGCGRYPLVIFCHGHCQGDVDHHLRWVLLPAQLARSGCVVVVPQLAGNAAGQNPSSAAHPDMATLDAVLAWARDEWAHAGVLLPPPATAIVGHSFGAMLGARFAVDRAVAAFAGLSGGWQDWAGDTPFPLPLLEVPSLLVWGGPFDFFSQLSESQWTQMRAPRHRAVFEQGEHWDHLGPVSAPCRPGPGACTALAAAVCDLVTMFLARYLPPEFAPELPHRVPATLVPPLLDGLTPQQQFFAGGFLSGFAALADNPNCGVEVSPTPPSLMANRRSRETHSLAAPCAWVSQIAPANRRPVSIRPAGYHWCDFCFPELADG